MNHSILLAVLLLFLSTSFVIQVHGRSSTIETNEKANNIGISPILINTWAFINAAESGWSMLKSGGSSLDAVEAACRRCQDDQCDHTVGWGGSPDENGETTLDAMIMDGLTHSVGAVGALRNVKDAIGVARAVMEHSEHTFLVGDQATNFARSFNFGFENLTSQWSANAYNQWKANNCQPNYWRNVRPNPEERCGPYTPIEASQLTISNHKSKPKVDENNHDTIGAVAIDSHGGMASATSTNGMIHKIPGRVGDSPIIGAGSYVDHEVGGAAATGDGDIIMRFLSSYQTVENLRQGMSPREAAENALRRILRKYPKAQVGIVVLNNRGEYGAACINIVNGFPYSIASVQHTKGFVLKVDCITK